MDIRLKILDYQDRVKLGNILLRHGYVVSFYSENGATYAVIHNIDVIEANHKMAVEHGEWFRKLEEDETWSSNEVEEVIKEYMEFRYG